MGDPTPLPASQMPEALVALAIGSDDVFKGAVFDDLIVAVKDGSRNAVRIGPWGGTGASGSQAPLVVAQPGALLNVPLRITPGANLASNLRAAGGTNAHLWAIDARNPDPGVDGAIGAALSNATGGVATWLTGGGAPRPSLWAFSNAVGDTSFNGDAFVVTRDRLVGVNCSNPRYQVDVRGAACISSNLSVSTAISIGPVACDNSYPFKVQSVNSSNVSIYAAGDIATFSDARKKREIRPIEGALDKVCSIGGYTFVRSFGDEKGGEKRMAGVLAQEVAPVFPEVVSADPAGSMHVSYGGMVPLLVEAIKELRAEVARLSNK